MNEPCTSHRAVPGGRKYRVLFLCTGNSCRSQMAEGWARNLHGAIVEPFSAGVVKSQLNEHAVQVMREVGVDISRQWSKTLEELPVQEFDLVFTLCDHAAESCPRFPGNARVIHVPFDDPPRLAAAERDPIAALNHYRRVRDEIQRFVASLNTYLPEPENPSSSKERADATQ
jgi:arsenate reductase